MSHSGGRSSVGGVRDLSIVSPILLELAGIKPKDNSPVKMENKNSPGGCKDVA